MVAEQLNQIAGITEDEFFALCDAFKALRGRLIVLLDEHVTILDSGIQLLDYDLRDSEHVKHRQNNKRLLPGTVVSSGLQDYEPGMRVEVFPWCFQGVLHLRKDDPACSNTHLIPEGRELRFYKPDTTVNEKGQKVPMQSVDQHGAIIPQGRVTHKVPLLNNNE